MTCNSKAAEGQIGSHADYVSSRLRDTSLFCKLSQQEISCFEAAVQTRSYKKGKVLYLHGESAKFFYIIASGWIKLFSTTNEGEEIILDMLTKGDIVGESAVFEHGNHTCSAQIVENVQLFIIPSKLLKEQIISNPLLAMTMLSSQSQHHRRRYSELAFNAMQSAPQRIAGFILKLCPKNEKKDIVLFLPYDKTLIAYSLGMKGTTFSRALKILKLKTKIRIINDRVEIDRVELLEKYVYGSASKMQEHDKV